MTYTVCVRSVVMLTLAMMSAAQVRAQSLPSPWTAADVGAPALSGSAAHAAGTFTVDAAGVDIWGSKDEFHFVYQQIAGDVQVIARVQSVTNQHAWSKAGVMIRASLAADAPHGFALASAAKGVHFQRRTTAAALSASSAGSSTAVPPAWIRIVRIGNKVTASWSANGTSWTTIGTDTIALGATAYVGLAATSHNSGARTTATISGVAVTRLGLPAGQQHSDIGGPALAGTASYSSGSYTIRAAGVDIWDRADQLHFVYQPMSGDGEVIARVASISNTHAWAKAGVMIRESLTADARHAVMLTSVGKGYAFQRRPDPAALTVHTAGGAGTPPGWVRLVRRGNQFDAYRSGDGTSWTLVGSETIGMAATVYAGIAVTSHNASALTTAVIDSFRLVTAAASNGAPAASVTSPSSGASYTMPATVTVAANATDPENRMSAVDFFANGTLIARDTTAPYSVSWKPAAAGTYSLTATAYDADGGSSTSAAVTVAVQAAGNQPPSVTFTTPANGAKYTAPATVSITVAASDPEGQLARVEFYNGSALLGSDTSAPYAFSWTSVPEGTYTLTAKVVDAAGASATTAAVTVTVSLGTQSTPPRYVVFTASRDHATNVTSYFFEVFAAGANPATATPVASASLGKPAPNGSNDITADQGTLFTNLPSGSYLATVTAIGSGGRTRSTAVTFNR